MGLSIHHGQITCSSRTLFFSYVLVLVGIELILFIVDCIVLYFGFVKKSLDNIGLFHC